MFLLIRSIVKSLPTSDRLSYPVSSTTLSVRSLNPPSCVTSWTRPTDSTVTWRPHPRTWRNVLGFLWTITSSSTMLSQASCHGWAMQRPLCPNCSKRLSAPTRQPSRSRLRNYRYVLTWLIPLCNIIRRTMQFHGIDIHFIHVATNVSQFFIQYLSNKWNPRKFLEVESDARDLLKFLQTFKNFFESVFLNNFQVHVHGNELKM